MSEPRLSVAYLVNDLMSIKTSVTRMTQYIHLLSSATVSLPTDLWVSSTDNINPNKSWQIALGVSKDMPERNLNFSMEGYYKTNENVLNYREGSSFIEGGFDEDTQISQFDWESKVTEGKGEAYGIEALLQRKKGKLSGWIGYTLSWTTQQFDDLNFGKKFFARYDRRHDLSALLAYNPESTHTISLTWVYGTGYRLTLPRGEHYIPWRGYFDEGRYEYQQQLYRDYDERNNFKMEPYHRMDLSFQFHKPKPKGRRTWSINVYNAYNRANPFFYTRDSKEISPGTYQSGLFKISMFPIIPSLNYRREF